MTEPSMDSMIVLETHGPQGATRTPYVPVAPPADDPFVRSRHTARGPGGEVITEYAAAPARPPSYPAWLPFVPARAVFTTEAQPGDMSPGARWPCASRQEADGVVAELERASAADGWEPVSSLHVPGTERVSDARVLVADARARLLLVAEADERAIVQLLDVPRTMLRARTA